MTPSTPTTCQQDSLPTQSVSDILGPFSLSGRKVPVWCPYARTLIYQSLAIPTFQGPAGELHVALNHLEAIQEAAQKLLAYADGTAAYLNNQPKHKRGKASGFELDGYELAYKFEGGHLWIGVQY